MSRRFAKRDRILNEGCVRERKRDKLNVWKNEFLGSGGNRRCLDYFKRK